MKLRWVRWLSIRIARLFLLLAVFLAYCQSKLIYMPRTYAIRINQDCERPPAELCHFRKAVK